MKTRQDLSRLSSDELIDLVLQQQQELATVSQISSADASTESRVASGAARSNEDDRSATRAATSTPSHSHHHHHRHPHRPWYKRLVSRVLPSTSLSWIYWVIILVMLVASMLLGLAIVIQTMQGGG